MSEEDQKELIDKREDQEKGTDNKPIPPEEVTTGNGNDRGIWIALWVLGICFGVLLIVCIIVLCVGPPERE